MSAPVAGWGGAGKPVTARRTEARRLAEQTSARQLLRRLVQITGQSGAAQNKLDQIVALIARQLVAEVCSVYMLRSGDVLELFATEGLAIEAVHTTRMEIGEGLVGRIASDASIINTDAAFEHPNFSYRPETGEDIYNSFLGVPIVRNGAVVGVLVVQNRAKKTYGEDEVEALEVIASVLAEMLSSGAMVDRSLYADVDAIRRPQRLEGLRLVEGVAVGRAWLHAPKIEVAKFVADDPEAEAERLDEAMASLQSSIDNMLEHPELGSGEHRDVLEAYRMFANDAGWLRRMREAIDTGLTAEAAVRRIQEETQLRLGQAQDPYIRERLLDLDDLANRLLMHLAGRDFAAEASQLPSGAIIVARNLSAADLVEYDRNKIGGIILEEGSNTAHVTVVARAFDVPMIGRAERAMAMIDSGDRLVLDGDHAQIFVRPADDVVDTFRRSMVARQERKRQLSGIRELPATSLDNVNVSLSINAAFLIDCGELDATNADGIGLYRTELAFMARPDFPDPKVQASYYSSVLDLAESRPVYFRTLDVGSDKQIPYWRMPKEENPAMGWRALRLMLDRPSILRAQLRALIAASSNRSLRVMFPMVAEVAEFDAAYRLLQLELKRAEANRRPPPKSIEVGAMMEVPALYWQLPALLPRVDFISVGSNDLIQFLFACDRGSPILSDRYDVLSPSALSFLSSLVNRCAEYNVKLSVCGEMASRPIEAMALIGLGVRHLSLSPAQIAPVKAMVRSLNVGGLRAYMERLMKLSVHSVRNRLMVYAHDHTIALSASSGRD